MHAAGVVSGHGNAWSANWFALGRPVLLLRKVRDVGLPLVSVIQRPGPAQCNHHRTSIGADKLTYRHGRIGRQHLPIGEI